MKTLAMVAASLLALNPLPASAKAKPNLVIIVADDLGFSDIGAFGSEIRTPNLDALASAGSLLTNFHAAPACSPTRAMLLSGTDNHTAGVGAMVESRLEAGAENGTPQWGYEGVITRRVATLAERLREGGYHTIFSGKWHLGLAPEQNPAARGFITSFALLQGASNHFGGPMGPADNPNLRATFTLDGEEVAVPADFYSTDYFTTQLLRQLDARPRRKPFFAYLAFTAPHWPLQAPEVDIARYSGRYDDGWAVLRQERLERMRQLGIVEAGVTPARIEGYAEAWDRLTPEQKRVEARKMEIFAAMVDRMDRNVGRLVNHLKHSGEFERTIFVFVSDNGPAGEGADRFARLPGMAAFLAASDTRYAAMGSKSSMLFLGRYWAQAASAPYRLFKGVTTEGGTRVPAFVTFAGAPQKGARRSAFASIMDIAPTLLEAASLPIEPIVEGRDVAPVRGRSMLPYLANLSRYIHPADEAITIELHGHRAVRQEPWKLLLLNRPAGDGTWALYNLNNDPAEENDLSADFPERRRSMIEAWHRFAAETKIAE
ncbi:hypothetical protein ASD67_17230 [Sphingopyxis sp. Root1497]|uniref:arylsulfatase n=1 Tax=Sphingopyxis sp. Root1497 TaxID=1736474 RepID=UPI0006FF9DA9|nr:arylsulfatase [Sphingopyxis sp. Root1497]KQZ61023.1 hypothetical protein ASD67_17230 [Sphingopyxis sp. Root1497]